MTLHPLEASPFIVLNFIFLLPGVQDPAHEDGDGPGRVPDDEDERAVHDDVGGPGEAAQGHEFDA